VTWDQDKKKINLQKKGLTKKAQVK
jgi:uncharacterized DUF497 family protein